MAARHVLAAHRTVIAKDTTGVVEAIRQLRRVARDGAVKARSAALNALSGLIVTAPGELREQLLACKTTRARATLCAHFGPDQRRLHDPEQAAKAALRSLARRVVADLDSEIKTLDHQLEQLVTQAAPITTSRVAVSTGHAATLLARPARTSIGSDTRRPSPRYLLFPWAVRRWRRRGVRWRY